jgi:hypothetical protein
MQVLFLNLRMSVRSLRKSPGFTLTALLTIALSIGAITSVFSVVNTVLLKPFAFHDPGELAILREVVGRRGKTSIAPDNYRHYLRLKKDATTIKMQRSSTSVESAFPQMAISHTLWAQLLPRRTFSVCSGYNLYSAGTLFPRTPRRARPRWCC